MNLFLAEVLTQSNLTVGRNHSYVEFLDPRRKLLPVRTGETTRKLRFDTSYAAILLVALLDLQWTVGPLEDKDAHQWA